MFDPVTTVSISLGSVVLDRPDQTGRYIAKDLAGGWAYIVGDSEGDNRCRGQGVCDGGLDLTLRCAFLSAANRVPDCSQIRILVETRQAHRMMVQLAVKDPHVIAAIGGRPVSILTRPEARSSFQVRTAAERAASVALRDREHAESHESVVDTETAAAVETGVVTGVKEADVTAAGKPKSGATQNWRPYINVSSRHSSTGVDSINGDGKEAVAVVSTPSAAIRWFANKSARSNLSAGPVPIPQHPPSSRAVRAWLRDFESHVETIRCDLQDVGA
jgi:hypothetical protein